MTESLPVNYVESFTADRLSIIAQALLDECYSTDDDLQSEFDSGYSIGCTRFDRQKNRLKNLVKDYEWLGITDPSNRLIMTIEDAPFRFTRDDYENPKKIASTLICDAESSQITKYTQQSQLSFSWGDELESFEESDKPIRWRFVVDVNESPEDKGSRDYEIYFVGYCKYDSPVCVWKYSEHLSGYVTSTDSVLAEAVSLGSAKTSIPRKEEPRKDQVKDE